MFNPPDPALNYSFPLPNASFPTALSLDTGGSVISYMSGLTGNSSAELQSPFYLQNYLDPTNGYQPFPPNQTSWSDTATYGGGDTMYSLLFEDNCPAAIHNLTNSGLDKLPLGTMHGTNVTVLSNGFCGSACAIVAGQLQYLAGANAVYSSSMDLDHLGLTNPPPIYSFAGGEVLDSSDVYTLLDDFDVANNGEAPLVLPTSASMSFTYRKLFVNTSNLTDIKSSLEFFKLNATYWVPMTGGNVLRPSRLWYDTAAVVGWLPPDSAWNCTDDVLNITQCQGWLTGRTDGNQTFYQPPPIGGTSSASSTSSTSPTSSSAIPTDTAQQVSSATTTTATSADNTSTRSASLSTGTPYGSFYYSSMTGPGVSNSTAFFNSVSEYFDEL